MTDTDHLNSRCILSHEFPDINAEGPFIDRPLARCSGNPADNFLQRYPLCLDCDLLHQYADRSLFSKLAAYMTESNACVLERQALQDIGYAAILKMLERLAIGDPDAQVVLPADADFFCELESLLNRIGGFIKEQVDESHDIAIGLCEHYETLLKLAGGDLSVRASEASPVELMSKLGELINRQVETFCEAINKLHVKERELLSLARLQRDIIEFLPDATFVIDSEHRIIAWNKAMAELSGVPEAEVLGQGMDVYSTAFYGSLRPLLIDLIDVDLEVVRQFYHAVEKRGETLIAEGSASFNHRGGERALWITASPLFDEYGTIVGAIESVRDVTDFKRAEAERELLKDQLHHAQKLDSIGQLAGGIAHEFNNILAAILGYAGLLDMRLDKDSPHRVAVQRIINASEKAASLTRSMLTFSRRQIVALEPVQVNSFVAGMKELLCRLAGENIRIVFDLSSDELNIKADQGQMQQIVLNLYNNARDAMPDGGMLTISTVRRLIAGNEKDVPAGMPRGWYVQLTVADTGHGIKDEDMERIFEPFFTTKGVGKGTGLGLAMVFGIVQQHEGHIKVTSSLNQGTRVSIWFPEYIRELSGSSAPTAADPGPERMHGSETILVGEDNEYVRPMIVELLQDHGYRVLEACDGSEVVALMNDFGDTVDLLLLDVIMPRMNGYDALIAVRKSYPDLPCLFLSGYNADILKQKTKISGEFEYLAKPVIPDKLLAAVRTALGDVTDGK